MEAIIYIKYCKLYTQTSLCTSQYCKIVGNQEYFIYANKLAANIRVQRVSLNIRIFPIRKKSKKIPYVFYNCNSPHILASTCLIYTRQYYWINVLTKILVQYTNVIYLIEKVSKIPVGLFEQSQSTLPDPASI